MEAEIKGILEILKIVRNHMSSKESEVMMSTFNTSEEVIKTIDLHILRLLKSDLSKINDLILLFLPTSDFQEISISSGWSEEYLKIANTFDNLIASIKKKNK